MTTTQTIATSPSDTGAECQYLLKTLTAKVNQLQGERQVLADLQTFMDLQGIQAQTPHRAHVRANIFERRAA